MPDLLSESATRSTLAARFQATRARTERLCAPLEVEDYQLQSMPDCSPPKWHLAHTAWFFETFVLARHELSFQPFHPQFCYLFNSYYNAVGDRWPRPARGLLSRPTVQDIYKYRQSTDDRILELIESVDDRTLAELAPVVEIGLNHEEQHQELLLTDLKHAFGLNPLRPRYASSDAPPQRAEALPLEWESCPSGVQSVGYGEGELGFAFDNEGPRHRVFLAPFAFASRPVTNGEYLDFIADNGYNRHELWLSDGWAARQACGWAAPLYWQREGTGYSQFTLRGMRPLNQAEPVCHVSYYEADAYARWAGARLPTEFEWETAIAPRQARGNFLDSERFHPCVSTTENTDYGNVWVWTASPYLAYPGYQPALGALGEYNGKFMCNQIVLRGGSCATPAGHVRPTYRNFFPPDARWQFSGLRLAKDVPS